MQITEKNPFDTERIANEWIYTIENQKHDIRDAELYPLLENWIAQLKPISLCDIGCGEGILFQKLNRKLQKYYGVDSSKHLITYATQKHLSQNAQFNIATAYKLPFQSSTMDAAISINVWFHLENIDKASEELSRILCDGGAFCISTVNPQEANTWKNLYSNAQTIGKLTIGAVQYPTLQLTENTFYNHSLAEIKMALARHHLEITQISFIGKTKAKCSEGLFVNIFGVKK
jgi:ubiquinone/menaquinone biosynthesis C-methylase UbiE